MRVLRNEEEEEEEEVVVVVVEGFQAPVWSLCCVCVVPPTMGLASSVLRHLVNDPIDILSRFVASTEGSAVGRNLRFVRRRTAGAVIVP